MAAVLLKRVKVAVDISPTIGDHRVRGIGTYTEQLVSQFKKGKEQIDFDFFKGPKSPPPTDIIHHPYFDLFFHTLPYKKSVGRVVTIHDVIPLVFPNYFPVGLRGYINLFLQKRALKNVDAVICDSHTSKADVVSKLSFPENKIYVVYLAPRSNFRPISDTKYLSSVTKKYSLPKKFALYVGDVNWNKNIPNLLEAVKIANISLVMVGQALVNKDLDQTKAINKLINKLDLEKKVIKTGYIKEEDLVSIYNLASLTVLPSYYEGFGLPVLESMACGTPVVCSKVASLSEIADSDAIFCDPEDPKDIAQKITYVLNLPKKQKRELSQKSFQHAAKFTWQKVARQTIDVYKSLLLVS